MPGQAVPMEENSMDPIGEKGGFIQKRIVLFAPLPYDKAYFSDNGA